MLMFAVRVPEPVGLNVTLIVHKPDTATLEPHLFVCEKSPVFAPVMVMLVMLTATPEGFASVMV